MIFGVTGREQALQMWQPDKNVLATQGLVFKKTEMHTHTHTCCTAQLRHGLTSAPHFIKSHPLTLQPARPSPCSLLFRRFYSWEFTSPVPSSCPVLLYYALLYSTGFSCPALSYAVSLSFPITLHRLLFSSFPALSQLIPLILPICAQVCLS